MTGLRALPSREFWPDDLTPFDGQRIHSERLLDSAQVTDNYLLALASAHGGKLETFNRHLVADAVVNGSQALHVIDYVQIQPRAPHCRGKLFYRLAQQAMQAGPALFATLVKPQPVACSVASSKYP